MDGNRIEVRRSPNSRSRVMSELDFTAMGAVGLLIPAIIVLILFLYLVLIPL